MKMPESHGFSARIQKDLNAGTIGLLVLVTLNRHDELYGYELVKLLTVSESDTLPMNQGAVYPVLRSFEKQKLVTSRMEPSDVGPARKYYRLTDSGRCVLAGWIKAWTQSTSVVRRFLSENAEGTHESEFRSSSDSKVSGGTGNCIKAANRHHS